MKAEFGLKVKVVLSLFAFIQCTRANAQPAKIANFAECETVYRVMESKPRECGTPDAGRLVENVKLEGDNVKHRKSGITVMVIEYGHPGPTRTGEPPSYYHGTLAVKRAGDGKVVTKGTADSTGQYIFVVPPGKYFITGDDQPKTLRSIRSDEIVVIKDRFTAVKLSHDNGMR